MGCLVFLFTKCGTFTCGWVTGSLLYGTKSLLRLEPESLRDHSKHFALDEENLGLEKVSELLGSHTWQVAELGPMFSSFQYDVAH